MTLDPTRMRQEFPILSRKNYLCSHSLGAVPRAASAALQEYYEHWANLGIQAWEGPWWETVVDFCRTMESLLRAPPETVCPLPNATRAMAAVASCLDFGGERNRIVMTDLEFTTFYPFWKGLEAQGAKIVLVESQDHMSVDPARIEAAIDERTLLVATCHAYFRSGAVQDLGRIVESAHDAGALVLGDGYQVAGTYPVDVAKLDVDFYVGGSHKYLCGGAGAGYLYVRKDHHGTLSPRLTGWFGLDQPFAYEQVVRSHRLSSGVLKFLDGTIAVPALYSAREGLRAVRKVGIDDIRAHSLRLTGNVIEQAQRRGLDVRTPQRPEQRSGMVCISFDGAKQATAALAKQDIVVDYRPDCGIRASPHFYNTQEDVDKFFDALDRHVRPQPAGPVRGARRTAATS